MRERLLRVLMDLASAVSIMVGIGVDIGGGDGWRLVVIGIMVRIWRLLENSTDWGRA